MEYGIAQNQNNIPIHPIFCLLKGTVGFRFQGYLRILGLVVQSCLRAQGFRVYGWWKVQGLGFRADSGFRVEGFVMSETAKNLRSNKQVVL